MKPEVKGPLILVLAVLSFSTMSALVKAAGVQIPVIEIVFFRGIFGLPILLVIAARKKVPLKGKRRGLLFWRGLTGTIALFMFFFAVTRLPVANSMLLNQSTPIFVLPLAMFFLKERVTRPHALLVLFAFAGVAMVISPAAAEPNLPGLLALGSAFFAAMAYVLVRKLTETEHTLTIVVWFTLIATAASAPAMIPVFVVPSVKILAVLAGMAVFATLGQLLLTLAYSLGEAGRLAVIGSMGAVFGAGFDFVFWDHVPGLGIIVGGVMIIGSCSLIQVIRRSSTPTRPA
jgi:drug/metabolite transporter (DMT)-like permease